MNSIEQKPEIINNVETNYKIAGRICQDLYIDVGDLFQEFIRSLPPQDIQAMDDDIKIMSGVLKTFWTLKIL